ncbi:MAG TPA: hypothetical protein VGI47_10420 [Candidatus Binataceae bacterium]
MGNLKEHIYRGLGAVRPYLYGAILMFGNIRWIATYKESKDLVAARGGFRAKACY